MAHEALLEPIAAALILTLQALVLAAFTLWMFRLRQRFGLGLFFVGVASLHSVEVQSSALISADSPWLVKMGGALFFSSKLFAVLLLYLKEDAAEARQLLYGLLLGSLGVLIAGVIGSAHVLFHEPEAVTHVLRIPAMTAFGLGVLVVDAVVLILCFEALARRLPAQLWLRIFVSMLLALAVDNVIYNAIFAGQEHFWEELSAGFAGKAYAAFLYSLLLVSALKLLHWELPRQPRQLTDVFDALTYRQRYEALRVSMAKDPVTGLLTRTRMEQDIPAMLTLPHSWIWMIDVDHFKSVNDRHGHAMGDLLLRHIADTVLRELPANSAAYRYGGEEFVVLGSDAVDPRAAAEKVRAAIAGAPLTLPNGVILKATVSIGVARRNETDSLAAVRELADQRLYRAKGEGRNRVTWVAPDCNDQGSSVAQR